MGTVVMMADCRDNGGYPNIASVIRTDFSCWRSAGREKIPSGSGDDHIEAAQEKYRTMMEK